MNRREAREEWSRLKEQRSEKSHGQLLLSERERKKVELGNQFTDAYSIMEWQCIKAAAVHNRVRDWIAKTDTSLTYSENVDRMRELGSETTMKDIYARDKQYNRKI